MYCVIYPVESEWLKKTYCMIYPVESEWLKKTYCVIYPVESDWLQKHTALSILWNPIGCGNILRYLSCGIRLVAEYLSSGIQLFAEMYNKIYPCGDVQLKLSCRT